MYKHVLKRVAVPDKETLKEVRWEVDVMVNVAFATYKGGLLMYLRRNLFGDIVT